MNAELSAMVEYLAKLDDMCVAKVMTYDEKSQRRAADVAGLKEALSILSESTLLQWTQTLQRVTIHLHETLSSNIASMKATIEDEAAKVASTSANIASLASQIVSSESDLTEASAVRAKRRRPGRPRRKRLLSSRRMQRTG